MRQIRIKPYGRLGNQMFQYMLALAFKMEAPNASISGYDMPAWGLAEPLRPGQERISVEIGTHRLPFRDICSILRECPQVDVNIVRLSSRYELYEGKLPFFRKVFARMPSDGGNAGELVISVRGKEILTAKHPRYMPVPLDIYDGVLARTNLSPVFVGQLEDNAYCEALRARYPGARFISHGTMLGDFNYIRSSKNVFLSISTYAWLAAWLSETAECIYLPLIGLYQPTQAAGMVPWKDERFRLVETALASWSGSEQDWRMILSDKIDFRVRPA
jgi:hypothetical protein